MREEIRSRAGINYRYYFEERNKHPPAGCPGDDNDFRNSTTWCRQLQGRNDAKTMLEIGQNTIHESLEEWFDSKELMKKYPNFRDYLDTLLPERIHNLF